jgi:Spy/CpxP family protein refolding chaperone
MTKLVVIFGFLVAFAAGVIVGSSRQQLQQQQVTTSAAQTTAPATRPNRESELNALLNLRPEQQQALKKIWSEIADRGRKEHDERRRELRRQRDEKIAALFSPADKAKFDQVHKDYEAQTQALEREMRSAFQRSVEQTKEVLDPDQRTKYEEWLRKRQWDRGPRGGPDRGDRNRERDSNRKPADAGATSGPSTQP